MHLFFSLGWEPQSWGYHGDDGNSFGGCGNGRPFGPVFTTGDTIGCGVNFRDMSLFYTKNGAYLGKCWGIWQHDLISRLKSIFLLNASFGTYIILFLQEWHSVI